MNRSGLRMGLVVLMTFWALTSRAQVTTGTISGTVGDSTGAVIPGARIVIQNEDTGISRTLTADAAGRYSAPSLALGNYRVTASKAGFQTEIRRGILLTVGREAVVNLQLSVGAVAHRARPVAQRAGPDTAHSTNPGVNVATNGSTGSAFHGWGMKISIGGRRSEDSSYFVDGTYINDMNHHIRAGPSGALLGVETVREFQVLTSSYGAQYGRTLGGVF